MDFPQSYSKPILIPSHPSLDPSSLVVVVQGTPSLPSITIIIPNKIVALHEEDTTIKEIMNLDKDISSPPFIPHNNSPFTYPPINDSSIPFQNNPSHSIKILIRSQTLHHSEVQKSGEPLEEETTHKKVGRKPTKEKREEANNNEKQLGIQTTTKTSMNIRNRVPLHKP